MPITSTSNADLNKEYIAFLHYLDNQAQQNEVATNLKNFIIEADPFHKTQDLQALKSLIRLCNKYACRFLMENKLNEALDLLERCKLSLDSSIFDGDVDSAKMKSSVYNNLAVYAYKTGSLGIAFKILEKSVSSATTPSQDIQGVSYNNMAVICKKNKLHEETVKHQKKALLGLENKVYKELKANFKDRELLKRDKTFIRSLNVMLNGYLNMGRFLQSMPNTKEQTDPTKFFKNGYRLSKTFIGQSSKLTQALKYNAEKIQLAHQQIQQSPQILKHEKTPTARSRLSNLISGSNDLGYQSVLDQNKLKDFLIKSNSSNSLTYRMAEKASSDSSEMTPTKRQSLKQQLIISLPGSVKQRSRRSHSNNCSASTEKRHFTFSPSSVDRSTEFDFEKLIGEKIENSIRKLLSEEFPLSKFQEKAALENEIQKLKSERAEVFSKRKEDTLRLEKLRLKLQQTQEMQLSAINSPSYRGHPFYPYPFIATPIDGMYVPPNVMVGNQYLAQQNKANNTLAESDNGTTRTQPSLKSFEALNRRKQRSNSEDIFSTPQRQGNMKNESQSSRQTLQLPTVRIDGLVRSCPRSSLAELRQIGLSMKPGSNSSKLNGRSMSQSFFTDELLVAPVMKTDTFGTGTLGNLVQESRKTESAQPLTRSKLEVPTIMLESVKERTQSEASSKETHTNLMGSLSVSKIEPNSQNKTSQSQKTMPSIFIGAATERPSANHLTPHSLAQEHQANTEGTGRKNRSVNFREAVNEDFKGNEAEKSSAGGLELGRVSNTKRSSLHLVKKESTTNTADSRGGSPFPSLSKFDSEFDDFSPQNQLQDSIQDSIIQRKPFEFLDYPEQFLGLENSVIRQAYFGLGDQNDYILECHYMPEDNDSKIKLIVNQQTANPRKPSISIAEEVVRIKDLKTLLQYMEYRDVIPSSLPASSIRDYKNFITYFVLPFVWVSEGGEPRRRLEIRAKARGVLSDYHECTFLEECCRITVTSVGGTQLKIVLDAMSDEQEKSIRFDVVMDMRSFDQYFERVQLTPAQNISEMIVELIEILEDETAEAEELDRLQKMIKAYGDEKSSNEDLEAVRFKGDKEEEMFLEMLGQTLFHMQGYLIEKGFDSIEKVNDTSTVKYLKIRINNGDKKDMVMVVEQPEKMEFKVYLKNFYETHAPEGTKVRAEGTCSYGFDNLWKDFGVAYHVTKPEERLTLCSMISEFYKIEVFEKPLTLAEYIAFKKNIITRYPLEYGCYERAYKGSNYKTPITISLIGIKGHPIGVKATIFNTRDFQEQGVFFTLDPSNWQKSSAIASFPHKGKKCVDLPMIEDYNLVSILNTYGFKIIQDYLSVDDTISKGTNTLRVKSMGAKFCVDVLENPLSFCNVVKYLRKKTDLLEPFDE